jgi:hypothetical protein
MKQTLHEKIQKMLTDLEQRQAQLRINITIYISKDMNEFARDSQVKLKTLEAFRSRLIEALKD